MFPNNTKRYITFNNIDINPLHRNDTHHDRGNENIKDTYKL